MKKYFFLLLLTCLTLSVNAQPRTKVKCVYINHFTYVGCGITMEHLCYTLDKDSLVLDTSKYYHCHPPKTIALNKIDTLLQIIYSNKQIDKKGLVSPFTKENVDTCISFLKAESGFLGEKIDTFDVYVFTAVHHLTKEKCLDILETNDVSNYLDLKEKISLEDDHFSMKFLFENGDSISIKHNSAYEGDYWIVNDKSYIKDKMISPTLSSWWRFYGRGYWYTKSEMLLEIIGQYYGHYRPPILWSEGNI